MPLIRNSYGGRRCNLRPSEVAQFSRAFGKVLFSQSILGKPQKSNQRITVPAREDFPVLIHQVSGVDKFWTMLSPCVGTDRSSSEGFVRTDSKSAISTEVMVL